MTQIVIIDNPMDPRGWQRLDADDTLEALYTFFHGRWPETARVYDLQGIDQPDRAAGPLLASVLAQRDITPSDEAGIERLGAAPGPLAVVTSPADPLTVIIAVVAVAIGVAAALFLVPKVPDLGDAAASPNNSLTDRKNVPRPGGRIPDIFGQVRSTPDLLTVPITTYEDDVEVEVCYMCVGRGAYLIENVRDGGTPLTLLAGAGAEFYGPGTSPNSGTPQLVVGAPVDAPLRSVVRLNEVNGQKLDPPDAESVTGDDDIRFVAPNYIETNSDIDFTEYFSAGDDLVVTGANIDSSITGAGVASYSVRFSYVASVGKIEFETVNPSTIWVIGDTITVTGGAWVGADDTATIRHVDLSGTYVVSAVSSTALTLTTPATINPYWAELPDFPSDRTGYLWANITNPGDTVGAFHLNGTYAITDVSATTITLASPATVNPSWSSIGTATGYLSPKLATLGEGWVGPFVVDLECDALVLNFVAPQGMYRISKKGKDRPWSAGIAVEVTPLDADGEPSGAPSTSTLVISGHGQDKTPKGKTLDIALPGPGSYRVRSRRTTKKNESATGTVLNSDDESTVIDEVKWRDCYGTALVTEAHFGDITTVFSRTYATSQASAQKERKLSCHATRLVLQRNPTGDGFDEDLAPSRRASDIIASICTDPYIGRRTHDQVDFDNIYDTVAEVESYFGSEKAGEFGHTFDDDNLSFEETLAIVTQCIFSRAYRQGSVIRLAFERATDSSVLLFNHRNVLPRTQERSVTFGVLDDHDGIELEWIAPEDGAVLTYNIPYDRTAISPRKVELPGIRSGELAYWHAWRAWNKMRWQSVSLEQECTQEAALVLPADRVLITDLTQPSVNEGDVREVDGLHLRLSQPVKFVGGVTHAIYLQLKDGTVEALSVSARAGLDPTAADTPYWVTLGSAPSLALSAAAEMSVLPSYEIVAASDRRNRAYLVTEREPQTNFTEVLRAVNYSPMYYINDEAVLWLPFTEQSLRDQSPGQHDGELSGTGSGTFVLDVTRGKHVYQAYEANEDVTLGDDDLVAPLSYSKSVWAKGAWNGRVLGSANEVFSFDGAGNVLASHAGGIVSHPVPTAGGEAWHHYAVTYDRNSERLRLYIDAELVDESLSVSRGVQSALRAFTSLVGRLDDLRLWKREISPIEITSLYRATKQPS